MGLRLTGKGSIWDTIGNVANTGANAVVAGVKDFGDVLAGGVGAITGNDEAANNALNAISRNNSNLTHGDFGQNIAGLYHDVADAPIATGERVANTVGAGVAGVEGLAGYGWDSVFGTPDQANRFIGGANNMADYWLKQGWGGKGGYLTPDQARSSGGGWNSLKKDFIAPTAAAVADVGPYVIGAPEFSSAEGALLGGAENATKRAIASKGLSAATNFGVGAGSSALSQEAATGHVNAGEALKQGATNTIASLVTDEVLHGAKKGEANIKEKIPEVSADYNPNYGEENLSALHDLNPMKPQEPASTPIPDPIANPADLAQAERAAAGIDQANATPSIDYSKVEGAGKSLQQAIATKAEELQSYDKGVKGGQMIPDGEGGYKRITEHSPFYSQYYAENGKPPTKAAYREYAEKLLRSGTDEESANYHNLARHADAEQELNAYNQADKQSGYNKVKVRDMAKGQPKQIPTAVIEKISSPEYVAKAEAGRFLQRIRDEIPGLEQQIKLIEAERKKLAAAKDIDGMRELNAKTADLKLRYRQITNMERAQSGEYSRLKGALDDKFPDTMLYKDGKAPRGMNPTVSGVPVRGGSEPVPRESGYTTQRQYDTTSITPSDITTSDKVLANTTGVDPEQVAAERLGKPQTGTLRIRSADTASSQIHGDVNKIIVPEGQISEVQARAGLRKAGYTPDESNKVIEGSKFTNKLGDEVISSTSLFDSANKLHATPETPAEPTVRNGYQRIVNKDGTTDYIPFTPAPEPKGDLMTPESYEKVFGVPMDSGVHIEDNGDSSYSPEFDHSIRDIPQQQPRNLAGDEAAFNAIRDGKSIDEAVSAYQEAAGVTKAEAEKAVNRVAETGLGMGSYEDVLKRNPVYGQLDDFPVHDMSDVTAKVDSTGRVLSHLQDRLNSLASGLSEGDIQLLDQLRGRDPAEVASHAENPELFKQVADAAKDISDYSHEVRRMNGDDTIYRQNYGAGMHYSNVSPEEQAAVSGYKSDLASKPGFSKERTIGDYGEAESKYNLTRKNANFLEDVAHDSRQTVNYVRERAALRSISDLYGPESVAFGSPTFEAPKQLNGLKDVFASKEVAKKWNDLHPQAEGTLSKILWKPYDAASSAVVQATVANPAIHGSNQFTQGFIAAGKMHGPEGGGAFIKNLVLDEETRNAIDARRFQAGDHNVDYGKNNNGIISRMTHGVTDLNKRAMSALDTDMRRSLFKTLTDDGMTDRDAVKTADKFMGDTKAIGNATRRFTFFFHYFKTMAGAIGEQVRHPIQNIGTITNAAVAAGTVWAINSVLQQATGNKNAHVHNPGELGLINEGIHSVENTAKGHYKDALQIVTNRVHPILREGTQQLFNQDLFTGKKISETGRGSHVANTLLPEANLAGSVSSDKKSAQEAALNFMGIYTPHAKGYQAAPNIPALNTSTTDSTGQVVPAKKGTGTDQQQAYFDTTEQAKKVLPAARQSVYDSIMKGETDENGQPIGRDEKQAQAHYADLASNPDVLEALAKQKQLYAAKTGTPLDPLYSEKLTPEQRQEYLHIQSLPYKGDDFIQQSDANAWVKQLGADRAAYFKTQDFSGVPPSERVVPLTFDAKTEADMTTAQGLEGADKAAFIKGHQNLQDAYDAIAKYTNDKRVAQGNAPFKLYPKADIEIQGILDEYRKLPKHTGSQGGSPAVAQWINANPDKYAKMQNYLASLSEYELANSAGMDKFAGAVPSQQELKAAYSLGKYDINKSTDASGKAVYSIDPQKAFESSKNSSTFNASTAAANKAQAFDRHSRQYFSHAGKMRGLKIHTNSQNRRVLDRTKLRVRSVSAATPKTGRLRIKSGIV